MPHKQKFESINAYTDGEIKSILELDYSDQESITPDIFKFTALENLHIKNCVAAAFPEGIAALSKLKHFAMENVAVTALPDDFGQLKALNEFTLSRMPIREMPRFIGNFKELETLFLHELALEDKTVVLPPLPEVDSLHLVRLGVERLEADFTEIPKLKVLDLAKNNLKALPASLAKAKKLETLVISYNGLTEFPRMILALPKLKRCYCDGEEIFHEKFRDRKNNESFFNACRTLKADEALAYSLYLLLLGDEASCEDIPLGHILTALRVNAKPIADMALFILKKRTPLALEKQPISPKSRIFMLGKPSRERETIKSQLAEAEVALQYEADGATTHILVGKGLTQKQYIWLAEADLPICFEADVERYLKNADALPFAPANTPQNEQNEQAQQLENLLLDIDIANVELALQMTKDNGLPDGLVTALFIASKRPELSKEALKQAQSLLSRYASPALNKKAQSKRKLVEKQFQRNNWEFFMEGTELEGRVILKFCGRYCYRWEDQAATAFALLPEAEREAYVRRIASNYKQPLELFRARPEHVDWLVELDAFETLYFAFSASLPDALFASQKVKSLDFTHVKDVEKYIPRLKNMAGLEELRLSGTYDASLLKIFYAMPQLKRIYWSNVHSIASSIDFSVYDEAAYEDTHWLVRKA